MQEKNTPKQAHFWIQAGSKEHNRVCPNRKHQPKWVTSSGRFQREHEQSLILWGKYTFHVNVITTRSPESHPNRD